MEMKKRIKYHIGLDFAIKPRWWQRLLVWFGFKKRWWDYSCAVVWKTDKNGNYIMIDKINL